MDRRRFEAAYLKYACLQMASHYPEAFSCESRCLSFKADIMETLNEITPPLFQCFETTYAGMLTCLTVLAYTLFTHYFLSLCVCIVQYALTGISGNINSSSVIINASDLTGIFNPRCC